MSVVERRIAVPGHDAIEETFVTITVAQQLCGIPVLSVRDVLTSPALAHIPLAPVEVAGSLNLRGRIVTAIDLRRRLGFPPAAGEAVCTSVVVERHGEFYSLIVDEVGDVLTLRDTDREAPPSTLPLRFRSFAQAVFRLPQGLLVTLDVPAVTAVEHDGPDERDIA